MLYIAGSLALIGAILLINQLLWQRNLVRGEASRKLAHIIIGSFIATWPLYMTYADIRWTLIIGLLGAIIVRQRVLFPSIFDVKRRSIGDIVAPIIILLAAFLEPSRTIFAVTVLHIAFADGMAALIGSRFGHKSTYNIFKEKKSLIGTATFFVASVLIMSVALVFRPAIDTGAFMLYVVAIPLLATFAENVSPRGLDNVSVPVIVITLLLLFG